MPWVYMFFEKEIWLYAKINTYTALEPPSALGLYRPTNSCEYVVLSLAWLLLFVSEEDATELEGGFFIGIDE